MHALPLFALTVVSLALGSVGARTPFATLTPIPDVAFVLQSAAIGTALGSAIALRAERRYGGADTWAITTAWATLGVGVGLVIEILSAIV